MRALSIFEGGMNKFIMLTPTSAAGLVVAGILISQSLFQRDVALAAFAIWVLMIVKSMAQELPASGTYKRHWSIWNRTGDIQQQSDPNVISFPHRETLQ